MVTLLVIQSFFIGVFNITLSVCAETMFLQTFEENMIGRAYLFSGIAGIVMTAIYSKLQSMIKFSKLAFLNLISISLIVAGIWYGFYITDSKWLIFSLFVVTGPLLLIPIINFSGMVLRLFTLRQGKRLFGIVDSGMVFGIIIVGFALPFMLQLIGNTKDLLFISTFGLIVSLIFQYIVAKNFDINKEQEEDVETTTEDKASYGLIFKDPYIRSMASFAAITMTALFFVQYSFLAVTKAQYPDEVELAGFLSNFTSAMMILSFLIKTFVYSKLVKTYGLQVSFLILPLILALFTIGAIISGHIFGYDSSESSFLFFFLLITLSRLFSVALREAIQNPSFKLLYQSLAKDIRFGIQAKIDGVINEISASLSGGILALLGLVTFVGLLHYSYILIGVLAIWCWITVKLYQQYKESLNKSLSNIKSSSDTSSIIINSVSDKLEWNIKTQDSNISESTLILQKIIEPIKYERTIQKTQTGQLKKHSFDTSNIDALKAVCKSKDTAKRRDLTVQLLLEDNIDSSIRNPIINELIKDIEPEVKTEAVKIICKYKISEQYHNIIDLLGTSTYQNIAFNAITETGEDILVALELAFHKTGFNTTTRVLIIQSIGNIGGPKAIELLLTKLNFPDRRIVQEVFQALGKCDLQADENIKNKLNQEIDSLIGISAWNIAARELLLRNKVSENLIESVNQEISQQSDLIYLLLSLAYDSKSINHIKENIESGSGESIGFSIELLDLFIPEDLKPKLFPLLEDISEEERINQLELYYPITHTSLESTLIDIINRDYNYCDKWTKVCAIHELKSIVKTEKVPPAIVANLFNPDVLIRESAAWAISSINSNTFQNTIDRIDDKEAHRLINITEQPNHGIENILFTRIDFLKKKVNLPEISNHALVEIAKYMDTISLKKGEDFFASEGPKECTYFIISGEINLQKEGLSLNVLSSGDIFGHFVHSNKDNMVATCTNDIEAYKISNDKIFELILLEPNLLDLFYTIVLPNEKNLLTEQSA